MLAHKVDGDHPTRLFAAQKVEKWSEARDPLLQKITTTGGLSVTYSQTPVYLFLSQKLKGNQTFSAQLATMEGNEVGEDSNAKPEWEEEVESSAEGPYASSGLCGAYHPISYIVHFANTVGLYQKKTQKCFGCGSPNHLIRDCPKDVGKITQKASLNMKEETTKMGGLAPQKPSVTQPVSLHEALSLKCLEKLPSWTQFHFLIGVDLRT